MSMCTGLNSVWVVELVPPHAWSQESRLCEAQAREVEGHLKVDEFRTPLLEVTGVEDVLCPHHGFGGFLY